MCNFYYPCLLIDRMVVQIDKESELAATQYVLPTSGSAIRSSRNYDSLALKHWSQHNYRKIYNRQHEKVVCGINGNVKSFIAMKEEL